MAIGQPDDATRELDDRCLHAEADPKERQSRLTRVAYRLEHAFDTANSKAARNENAVEVSKQLAGSLTIDE